MRNGLNKIRAVLVDDEPSALETLGGMLSEFPEIVVVGKSYTGKKAVRMIQTTRPDVVFLDIQMPDMSGFDVIEKLNGSKAPIIVLVTAYDEYALKAFDSNAIDYVLKPYDDRRLRNAVQKVKAMIHSRKPQRRFAVPLRTGSGAGFLRRFLVKQANRISIIPVGDVEWIGTSGDYIRLHVRNETHLLHARMNRLLEELDPLQFVRVHRSAAVNVAYVKSLEPLFHRDYVITLKNGHRLTLSRTYAKSVFEILKGRPQ